MFIFLGPSNRCVLNQMVHLMFVLVVKRRNANYHFVNQDSQGPPIYREVVPGANNHFRGQILWCATKRIGLLSVILNNFCEPEVCKHDVAIFVQ